MARHLPNLVTASRIAAVPFLWWLAIDGRTRTFGGVLLACLAGDVCDGLLARRLGATSTFGAHLDSLADALLFVTAAAGVAMLFPADVAAHRWAFWSVPVAWVSENVAALLRYGRLSSFHTYMSKAAAGAMAAFAVVLFWSGFETTLLRVAAVLVTAATLEEFALLYRLPHWTANVRGLFWVIRQQGMSR